MYSSRLEDGSLISTIVVAPSLGQALCGVVGALGRTARNVANHPDTTNALEAAKAAVKGEIHKLVSLVDSGFCQVS